ncbi:ABC transporter related protein [Haloterrigena turkmenica DSM 5511]|uniref:ABC transporter related protein n=1 Tax=Haloterrigena turkmenica (strain ATCC 51198 / DSM 5511 / JCM 9101 / NCIMB 13204 / VKM B-1734 / 4k) TaxID=543526 RepID=D2RPS6_HALTV|nr:ABC transporter ATP-binding protein [Haloterrigena turkmenica]ADB62228.1 ABC transporter related protein [Haloterrigena turkmenica DSM 5511]
MAAIETTGLTKRYGQTVAVDDLELSIPEGSVYGFLGPNGAGKTTTMRLLTSLARPTEGSAAVAGVSITDRARLRPRVGYLPETPPLYERATGLEQLEYVAGLRDLHLETARDRIHSLLADLDLLADAETLIDDYSTGMRQKVAFVQAVLHDPDVVFLDEPTSGLDPRAAKTIRERIRGLADGGTTVFLSTHILPVVEAVADTVGILSDGRLVAEGAPDALARRAETGDDGTLEDVFLELTDADPIDSARDGAGSETVIETEEAARD